MADQIEGNLPDAEPVAETSTESSSLDRILSEAIDGASDPDLARDERGRFAPKNTEPEADAEGTGTAEQTPEAKPAETQPLEPHPRWSADLKAQFSQWPRNVQETFLARHNEVDATLTRKTQEIAEFRKSAEPLVEAIKPFGEYLNQVSRQLNTSPPALVQELLKTEYALRTGSPQDKATALARIAQSYGIDLAALAGPATEGQNGYRPDPFVNQLYQQFPAIETRLSRMEQVAQTIEQQQLEQYVESIRVAKNSDGSLKYPYFDKVREHVGALMTQYNLGLDEAYEKAVDPFRDMLQSQAEAAKQQADQVRREAVEKAKRAAPVRSSGTAPRGNAQAKGLDAILAGAMSKAGY